MNGKSPKKGSHHSAHDATHQPWDYGPGAVIWDSAKTPLAVNLHPFANSMSAWLRQEHSDVLVPMTYKTPELERQRNPYSQSLATLGASIALVIEDAFRFIESADDVHPAEAEIRRVRLECEIVLYAARFSEAAIKQMLHCTAFPRSLYRDAAMGKLLAVDCRSCRVSNLPPHSFSLLGSLAHQFFLCHEIDNCALDHLLLANKRRNMEAAHSDAQQLRISTAAESRKVLRGTLDEVVRAFEHLLGHIAGIEAAMIKEIALRMTHYPKMPPQNAYDYFLTRTVADYDREGVYRGLGYGSERVRRIRARGSTPK